MINFNKFLKEEENPAHKKARALGLKYRGFGYWANPTTGEVEYKTRDGELVPTGDKLKTEKGPNGQQVGADMKSVDQQLPTAPSGDGSGIGDAIEPEDDGSWTPGPTGDNAINTESEVPKDVFVRKGNDEEWIAGADGSNIKNLSFDKMVSEAMETKKLNAREEARKRGLTSDGHGRYLDNSGTIVAIVQDGELVDYDPAIHGGEEEETETRGGSEEESSTDKIASELGSIGMAGGADGKAVAQAPGQLSLGIDAPADKEPKSYRGLATMQDKIRRASLGPEGDEGTVGKAVNALAGLSDEEKEQAIRGLEKTIEKSYLPYDHKRGEKTKAMDGWKLAQTLKASVKDKKKVDQLNEDIKNYVTDPDYDLMAVGEELGEGAFGSVYEGKDGYSVIKQGAIGMEEIKALYMLSDSDQFPAVINAKFITPFKHQSSIANNEFGDPGDSAKYINTRLGKGYFNPDDQSDFEEKFATAHGRFAMSKASGRPIADIQYDWDENSEPFQEFVTKAWQARATMHLKGISHNDMHGGNIYVNDEDDGHVTILDLGIAKVDKIAALMEAFGGVSGEDYQMTDVMSRSRMRGSGNPIAGMLEFNHHATIEKIYEDFEDQWTDDMGYAYEDLKEGGIRLGDEELEQFQSIFGFTEEQLDSYLEMMYKGILPEEDNRSDIEKRMEKGYKDMVGQLGDGNTQGEDAAKMIRHANKMRKMRGEKAIDIKGLDLDKPYGDE